MLFHLAFMASFLFEASAPLHTSHQLESGLLRLTRQPNAHHTAENNSCSPAGHDTILASSQHLSPYHLCFPEQHNVILAIDLQIDAPCTSLTTTRFSYGLYGGAYKLSASARSRYGYRTYSGDCQQTKNPKTEKKNREDSISVTRKHDAVNMYLAADENAICFPEWTFLSLLCLARIPCERKMFARPIMIPAEHWRICPVDMIADLT